MVKRPIANNDEKCDDAHSNDARFLRYARGRVRHFWMRQSLTVFGALAIAATISADLGVLTFLIALAGELLDCGTLRRANNSLSGGQVQPIWKTAATLTAGLQALSITACVLAPLIGGGRSDGAFFSSAFLAAATINAGLALPYFRPGGWIRLFVYTLASIVVALVSALSGNLTLMDMLAMAALALSVAFFVRFVTRVDQSRQHSEKNLIRQQTELAHQVANLEATRRELDTLALVARHANDSVILSDSDGRITWVNDAFTKITGYAADEVMGRTPADFLNSPRATKDASQEIEQAKKDGRVLRIEVLNMRKDGTDIWIDTSIVPIAGTDGHIHTILSVERDVTAAKTHEEELRAARKKADEGARAKSKFFATISHEIRTPMNAVLGMSELLLEGNLHDEERGYAQTINDSASALLDIVNDILDLSKLDSGKLEICREKMALRNTVASAFSLFRAAAEQKGLSYNLKVSDALPNHVMGDAGRMRQILVNVIGNALKFTKSGSIDVDVRPGNAKNMVSFSIRDTGIGIPDEKLSAIFDEFSQAESTTTRNFGGTGLGLSISRNLARLMGGDITAGSTLRQGSVFDVTLCLPRTKDRTDALPAPPRALTPGLRILVADDNATNRLLVCKFLHGSDVALSDAQDGKEALELAKRHSPDIILMDMQMPIMDGLAATGAIRAIPPPYQQPVIVALTANADTEHSARCLEAGMDLFLSKPIRKQALIKMVEQACLELTARRSGNATAKTQAAHEV